MINANEVREIAQKIFEEKEKVKKETAIRLVNEVIEPSILAAAKRGEYSIVGTVEPECMTYVRKEIESNGFTTHCVGQGRLKIVW